MPVIFRGGGAPKLPMYLIIPICWIKQAFMNIKF